MNRTVPGPRWVRHYTGASGKRGRRTTVKNKLKTTLSPDPAPYTHARTHVWYRIVFSLQHLRCTPPPPPTHTHTPCPSLLFPPAPQALPDPLPRPLPATLAPLPPSPSLPKLLLRQPSSEEAARKRCSEANSKHWFTTSFLRGSCQKAMLGGKLQALVYNILPPRKLPESDARRQTPSTGLRHPSLEEAAGKRCSECGSEGGSHNHPRNPPPHPPPPHPHLPPQ